MPARTDIFDLGRLSLSPGEARRLDLETTLGVFKFGAETYRAEPREVPVRLDVTRMASGWSLRLRFTGAIAGACMRCLEPALQSVDVDAREVDQPGGGEELSSPYVADEELDLRAWAHDAFALALPGQITCREECAGLCPRCGENLNEHPDHAHEPEVDPRWAKLAELKLEADD
jgi:uncharacterized protein